MDEVEDDCFAPVAIPSTTGDGATALWPKRSREVMSGSFAQSLRGGVNEGSPDGVERAADRREGEASSRRSCAETGSACWVDGAVGNCQGARAGWPARLTERPA